MWRGIYIKKILYRSREGVSRYIHHRKYHHRNHNRNHNKRYKEISSNIKIIKYSIHFNYKKTTVSYINLLNHGFIKSLLFILNGYIVNITYYSDIRKIRGGIYIHPVIIINFIILFIQLSYIFLIPTKEYHQQSFIISYRDMRHRLLYNSLSNITYRYLI